MVLVESIPLHMKYKANVTIGFPLEKAWKDLLSIAEDQLDVVSFYWTLTGDDINVNSSSDAPVRCRRTLRTPFIADMLLHLWKHPLMVSLSSAGKGHPEGT